MHENTGCSNQFGKYHKVQCWLLGESNVRLQMDVGQMSFVHHNVGKLSAGVLQCHISRQHYQQQPWQQQLIINELGRRCQLAWDVGRDTCHALFSDSRQHIACDKQSAFNEWFLPLVNCSRRWKDDDEVEEETHRLDRTYQSVVVHLNAANWEESHSCHQG